MIELPRDGQEGHVGGGGDDNRGARAHQVADGRLESWKYRGHEAHLGGVYLPAEATLLELGGRTRDARLQPCRLVSE